MGPIASFLAGPIGGALTSAVGGLFGSHSARSAERRQHAATAREAQLDRDFQAGQAGRQMDFQERMRSTAYQTAMQDMRKAGLNPILAYQQGGAPMAAGAAGSGSRGTPQRGETPSDAAQRAASAIAAIRNMHEQNRNLQEQNKLIRAQELQAGASTALGIAQAEKTRAETTGIEYVNRLKRATTAPSSWFDPDGLGDDLRWPVTRAFDWFGNSARAVLEGAKERAAPYFQRGREFIQRQRDYNSPEARAERRERSRQIAEEERRERARHSQNRRGRYK